MKKLLIILSFAFFVAFITPPHTLMYQTTVVNDTTYVTYQVTHDTIETTTIPEKIIHTGDTVITLFDTSYLIYNIYEQYASVDGSITITVPLYDTIPSNDTTFTCHGCAVHDTTTFVINADTSNTIWGVFILNNPPTTLSARTTRATNLSDALTSYRYNVDRGDNTYSVHAIHAAGLLVAMSYQNQPVQNTAFFPTGAALTASAFTLDSLFDIETPDLLSIENEESNQSYHKGTPQDYINELNTLGAVAHAHGVPYSNGGTLIQLVYYIRKYYQDHGLTDSVNWINTAAGLSPGTGPAAQAQINWYSVVIPAFRNSNMDYVNFHHYEPPRTDTVPTTESGLTRVIINFLKQQTGKEIITTEFGTRNHSNALLIQMCNIIKDAGVKWAIYFDGDGSVAFANEPAYKTFLNSLLSWQNNIINRDIALQRSNFEKYYKR